MYKILTILLAVSSTSFAALPPLAQSNREIKAILDSQETYRLLGGAEPLEQIVRTKNGYLLITTHKELLVDVDYIPSDKMGPIPFKLHFHTPVDTE